jgi:hypothetical protein
MYKPVLSLFFFAPAWASPCCCFHFFQTSEELDLSFTKVSSSFSFPILWTLRVHA